jgi:hypothetical protein
MENRGLNLNELRTRLFENEEQLQAAAMDLIRNYFPEFYLKAFHPKNEQHIPRFLNESPKQYESRTKFIGNNNKRKGKLAGVMDICIRYKGVFFSIELKLESKRNTKNGGRSPEQQALFNEWMLDCSDVPPLMAYNLLEVYKILCWILTSGFRVVKM